VTTKYFSAWSFVWKTAIELYNHYGSATGAFRQNLNLV
jgi:hypothetical protein